MNYQTHYNLLISRGQSRILECYSEKHHVIPRCLDGDNSEDNLVKLTPEEHYLAHQLLVKIYPGNHKLVYAANMMANTRPGNKHYGWLRRKHSMAMSETFTGRTKETHPGVKTQSEKMTGRTKENNSGVKATSEKMSGRTKENDPGMKAMSETLTGRTKETHPGVRARSEKMSGRTKENHPGVKAMSEKKRILSDEQEQILFNMRENKISGKEIVKYFKKLDFHIAYSSVFTIYNRVKQEKITIKLKYELPKSL